MEQVLKIINKPGQLKKRDKMSHEKSPNTGPFVIYNGEISDAAIWEAEMDEELERKFDE